MGRKFLGYALWVSKGREVKCAVARKAVDNFKARIRQHTRRSGGRSTEQLVQKLPPYKPATSNRSIGSIKAALTIV